jgi:hypothetical protein
MVIIDTAHDDVLDVRVALAVSHAVVVVTQVAYVLQLIHGKRETDVTVGVWARNEQAA